MRKCRDSPVSHLTDRSHFFDASEKAAVLKFVDLTPVFEGFV